MNPDSNGSRQQKVLDFFRLADSTWGFYQGDPLDAVNDSVKGDYQPCTRRDIRDECGSFHRCALGRITDSLSKLACVFARLRLL